MIEATRHGQVTAVSFELCKVKDKGWDKGWDRGKGRGKGKGAALKVMWVRYYYQIFSEHL